MYCTCFIYFIYFKALIQGKSWETNTKIIVKNTNVIKHYQATSKSKKIKTEIEGRREKKRLNN